MTTTTKLEGAPTGWKYNYGASALLFSGKHKKALRLEVPDLGKEFSDTNFIGTDPEGSIYYDDEANFDPDITVYYKIYKSGDHILIKFSHKDFKIDPNAKTHAEFWAEDQNDTVSATGMDGYSDSGTWKELNISTAPTTLKKYQDMDYVAVSAPAVKITGQIQIPETTPPNILENTTFEVRGNLYFRDETTISDGICANYNNDRVVFYDSDWDAKDFKAYFIPYETPQQTLNVPTDQTQIYGVTWSVGTN